MTADPAAIIYAHTVRPTDTADAPGHRYSDNCSCHAPHRDAALDAVAALQAHTLLLTDTTRAALQTQAVVQELTTWADTIAPSGTALSDPSGAIAAIVRDRAATVQAARAGTDQRSS